MKKLLISILLCLCPIMIFAEILAEEKAIDSKYGTLTALANNEITYYENGNIKSVYVKENIVCEMPCGKVVVTSYGKYPLTFYEDGTLESGYIPYYRPKAYPSINNEISTGLFGIIGAKKEHQISFWKNGTPKSFTVAQDKIIKGLGTLQANSLIKFYESSYPEQLTLKESLDIDHYGTISAKGKPIYFYENGCPKSITAAEGAYFTYNSKKILLKPYTTVSFYENQNRKQLSFVMTDEDIKIGDYFLTNKDDNEELEFINDHYYDSFSAKERSDKITVTFTYYENGNIESVSTEESQFPSVSHTFVFNFDSFYAAYCTSVSFYEDGRLKSMDLEPAEIISDIKENYIYRISKYKFSEDQKQTFYEGIELFKSPEGRVYDTSTHVILNEDFEVLENQ